MDKQDEPAEILRPAHELLWTLISLWDEMGIDQIQRDKRLQRAQEMVSSLVQDLVAEERETKRMVVARIDDLRRRIEELSIELSITFQAPDDNLSMVKLEKVLHTRLTGLREQKHRRLMQLETLRRRDARCCERLGEVPFSLSVAEGTLPSDAEMQALEVRVDTLTKDMDDRLIEVKRLRDTLQECLEDLDLTKPDDYSQWFLLSDPEIKEKFPLTTQSLCDLESVVLRYRLRRDTAAERCKNLKSRIELLWNRLNTSEKDRQLFLEQLPISQPASLRLLEAEVSRLEQLKQANIARFLDACKDDLRHWRERCFIGEEEQREWDNATAEEESPDIALERYEAEISRLKTFFADNESVFQKVTNWNFTFEKLRITELRMKDPNVLSNRGGVLLKYEKTKRATLKTLKSLELAMGTAVNVRIEGLPILVYVERRRQAYETEKENEKRERQEKANSLLQREIRYGSKPALTPTSRKRILGHASHHTNNTTLIAAAPGHGQSKMRKLTSAFATPEPRTPRSRHPSSVSRVPSSTPRSVSSVSSGLSKLKGPVPRLEEAREFGQATPIPLRTRISKRIATSPRSSAFGRARHDSHSAAR